jgi:hypothetical protein
MSVLESSLTCCSKFYKNSYFFNTVLFLFLYNLLELLTVLKVGRNEKKHRYLLMNKTKEKISRSIFYDFVLISQIRKWRIS